MEVHLRPDTDRQHPLRVGVPERAGWPRSAGPAGPAPRRPSSRIAASSARFSAGVQVARPADEQARPRGRTRPAPRTSAGSAATAVGRLLLGRLEQQQPPVPLRLRPARRTCRGSSRAPPGSPRTAPRGRVPEPWSTRGPSSDRERPHLPHDRRIGPVGVAITSARRTPGGPAGPPARTASAGRAPLPRPAAAPSCDSPAITDGPWKVTRPIRRTAASSTVVSE